MSAFHRTGQGLETDIIGTAVTAEGDELEVILHLALFLEDIVSSFYTAAGSGSIFKCTMDVAVCICGIRIQEGRNLQTAGCIGDNSLILRLQCTQYTANRNTGAAAGTQTVTADKTLFLR